MLLPEPDNGLRVKGELYAVDEAQLTRIDAIESVGKPGNLRIVVQVEMIDGERCEAFAYAESRELATPAHSAFPDDYRDTRFIPPWQRGRRG
jgi:gamma-glutamylaminecyclotransferase